MAGRMILPQNSQRQAKSVSLRNAKTSDNILKFTVLNRLAIVLAVAFPATPFRIVFLIVVISPVGYGLYHKYITSYKDCKLTSDVTGLKLALKRQEYLAFR